MTKAIKTMKRKGKKTLITERKKEKEFQSFMLWLSLPSVFMGKPDSYLESVGIKNEEEKELLKIKNLTQFAEKFKLKAGTLSRWKKQITTEQTTDKTKDYFKKLSKNIYGAFYHSAIKHGDAPRVRLWEEIFNEKEAEGGKNININIINLAEKKPIKVVDETIKLIKK